MKIFNRLICAGVFAMAGLCGIVNAADINITSLNPAGGYQTNWTRGENYLFYNDYSGWGASEQFSGSTTANGGTTTVTAGLINVKHLTGTKYLSIYGTPTTSTGSITVNVYEWFGTETVTAANGTEGAYLRSTTTMTFATAVGTSTLITITDNPLLMAVGIKPTSGSITTTIGLNSSTSR